MNIFISTSSLFLHNSPPRLTSSNDNDKKKKKRLSLALPYPQSTALCFTLVPNSLKVLGFALIAEINHTPEFIWQWTKQTSSTESELINSKWLVICVHTALSSRRSWNSEVYVVSGGKVCACSPSESDSGTAQLWGFTPTYPPPQPGPTIPPSGLDYKSMEEFINEEACRGTMEGNRSCLRQYGPGRSDG